MKPVRAGKLLGVHIFFMDLLGLLEVINIQNGTDIYIISKHQRLSVLQWDMKNVHF